MAPDEVTGCCNEDLNVQGLNLGYHTPFHNPLPVAQEPWEFLSCGSVSSKAQALQDEVN